MTPDDLGGPKSPHQRAVQGQSQRRCDHERRGSTEDAVFLALQKETGVRA